MASDLTDERLDARLDLLCDCSIQAWHGSTQGNVFAGGVLAALERAGGAELVAHVRGDVGDLTSAAAVVGVDALAARARHDPDAARILAEERPAEALRLLRQRGGELAARLDALLVEVGHRGPGETELANPVFADRPELLVDAVAKAMSRERAARVGVPLEVPLHLRPLAALALRHVRDRERARDAAMRLHHALRLVLRERGRRLQAAGALDAPEDVFFLTLAELRRPPSGLVALVAERRAERERLAALVMPAHFQGHWVPERGGDEPLEPGEGLDGIAAAPGRVRGEVRVLADAGSFDLEPGEVLVARTTDTGWTPMFAFAAAVVTDIGGMASHPAVVAREYGIPAVLNTATASTRLPDGALVEVDGDAGRVTRIE